MMKPVLFCFAGGLALWTTQAADSAPPVSSSRDCVLSSSAGVFRTDIQNGLELTDGKLSKQGRLIIRTFGRRETALPPGQDFGMMVHYDQDEEHPHPGYEVFLQEEHCIVKTESFAAFTGLLDGIPDGTKIYLFDECASGTHWKMPERYMFEIKDALKARKLELAEGSIICRSLE